MRQTVNFPTGTDRAWMEIDQHALIHNLEEIKKQIPFSTEIIAVLKANAYGHGMIECAQILSEHGHSFFAVSTVDEAIQLREHGFTQKILILSVTAPSRVQELHQYQLIQTVSSLEYAQLLDEQEFSIDVHLKIETGMHRLGISKKEEVQQILKLKHLHIQALFTHLCDSEHVQQPSISDRQIKCFYDIYLPIKKEVPHLKHHIQASYGILQKPDLKCDYARIGLFLYGVTSHGELVQLDLKPVMSLKARICHLQYLNAGEGIGYGHAYHCTKPTKIATVSIGYHDGLPRVEGLHALVHGVKVPVVGHLCMDQCMLDVTDVPDVKLFDEAAFIHQDLPAYIMAKTACTITNVIVAQMNQRIKRVIQTKKNTVQSI